MAPTGLGAKEGGPAGHHSCQIEAEAGRRTWSSGSSHPWRSIGDRGAALVWVQRQDGEALGGAAQLEGGSGAPLDQDEDGGGERVRGSDAMRYQGEGRSRASVRGCWRRKGIERRSVGV